MICFLFVFVATETMYAYATDIFATCLAHDISLALGGHHDERDVVSIQRLTYTVFDGWFPDADAATLALRDFFFCEWGEVECVCVFCARTPVSLSLSLCLSVSPAHCCYHHAPVCLHWKVYICASISAGKSLARLSRSVLLASSPSYSGVALPLDTSSVCTSPSEHSTMGCCARQSGKQCKQNPKTKTKKFKGPGRRKISTKGMWHWQSLHPRRAVAMAVTSASGRRNEMPSWRLTATWPLDPIWGMKKADRQAVPRC